MTIKTSLQTSVAAIALFAMAAPVVSSPADAGAWNGGNKNKVVMSGQIHRGIMYADDGENSALFNTGGGTTSTRLRWIATGQVNESVSVKGLIEMNTPTSNDVGSASLGTAGNGTNRSISDRAWGIRHLDIKFAHKTMGAFSIGQGNTASNGKSEMSYSGTGNTYLLGLSTGGGLDFYNTTTKTAAGVSIGDLITDFDGLSRDDRIRYDLPSFNGFNLGVSYVDGGAADIGGSYSAKLGSVSVKAAAQYNNTSATSTTTEDTWSTSGAVIHDSGLNASAFYGSRESKTVNIDPTTWGVAVGYKSKLNSLGTTAFNVGYQQVEETNNVNGDEAEVIAIAIQQEIDSVGTSLWATYQQTSYDTIGANSFDDISVVYAGATVRF